ncbi:hypothetical protein E5288_WYG014125 [Bos mutus]|uniref:Uncharacterized protein n=1 Tax=Bos mutus TaxID=72004 RepID=A0A6B0RXT0_9CETA|nr:hypothetical protein [Bos mutus]
MNKNESTAQYGYSESINMANYKDQKFQYAYNLKCTAFALMDRSLQELSRTKKLFLLNQAEIPTIKMDKTKSFGETWLTGMAFSASSSSATQNVLGAVLLYSGNPERGLGPGGLRSRVKVEADLNFTYFLLTSLAEFQWLLSKPGAETPLRRSVNQPICAKEVQALDSILTSGLQFIFQCLNATIYLQPTPAPFLTSLSRGGTFHQKTRLMNEYLLEIEMNLYLFGEFPNEDMETSWQWMDGRGHIQLPTMSIPSFPFRGHLKQAPSCPHLTVLLNYPPDSEWENEMMEIVTPYLLISMISQAAADLSCFPSFNWSTMLTILKMLRKIFYEHFKYYLTLTYCDCGFEPFFHDSKSCHRTEKSSQYTIPYNIGKPQKLLQAMSKHASLMPSNIIKLPNHFLVPDREEGLGSIITPDKPVHIYMGTTAPYHIIISL